MPPSYLLAWCVDDPVDDSLFLVHLLDLNDPGGGDFISAKDVLIDRIRSLSDDLAQELLEHLDEILEDLYDMHLAEEATRRLVESGKLPAEYLEKIPKSNREA